MKWSVFSSAASLFSELNRYEMIFSPGTLDAKMSHSELLRVFSGLESSMLNASAKKPARGLSLFADQVMLCSDAEYPISQSPDVVENDVFISSITLFCRLREPMVSCSLFPAVLMEEIYASEMISPESSS